MAKKWHENDDNFVLRSARNFATEKPASACITWYVLQQCWGHSHGEVCSPECYP